KRLVLESPSYRSEQSARICFKVQTREAAMSKEPIFTLREFVVWAAILGSVVGYQLWNHADPPPLTIDLATIEPRA
ncbi:hypothetical protein, partial [Sinorhizobium meliloti]